MQHWHAARRSRDLRFLPHHSDCFTHLLPITAEPDQTFIITSDKTRVSSATTAVMRVSDSPKYKSSTAAKSCKNPLNRQCILATSRRDYRRTNNSERIKSISREIFSPLSRLMLITVGPRFSPTKYDRFLPPGLNYQCCCWTLRSRQTKNISRCDSRLKSSVCSRFKVGKGSFVECSKVICDTSREGEELQPGWHKPDMAQ